MACGVGGRQEETLCSREDAHYNTEVLLPANLQSENLQATEPEAENVLGRSCCIAAFVVLFSHEDEEKLLTVTVLSSKRFWFLKSSPCAFPEAPRPCLTQTSAHPPAVLASCGGHPPAQGSEVQACKPGVRFPSFSEFSITDFQTKINKLVQLCIIWGGLFEKL